MALGVPILKHFRVLERSKPCLIAKEMQGFLKQTGMSCNVTGVDRIS